MQRAVTEAVVRAGLIGSSSLPSSSKRVLRILDRGGILSYKDIVRKTRLNPRTVRYALKKLKEQEFLIQRLDLHDLRQITYQVRDLHPSES